MTKKNFTYIDLFCGIGGFHVAAGFAASQREITTSCLLASDIDPACRKMYKENFGLEPRGDIKEVETEVIPFHDILFAGFPCQPFSIIGGMRGFDDTRGTLFFEIARILEAKKPTAFVLENVKMLVGHQQGRTLARILESLAELGYRTTYRVLNALDFGVPQKRERVLIVGFLEERISSDTGFLWPSGGVPMPSLSNVLEENVDSRYYASEAIRTSRHSRHQPDSEPTIWHENKSGNISKLNYSCALRAGASYNYLLVDGERRLTEREMLRLQGFPDDYRVVCSYSEVRKQAGNSVPVPMIQAVIGRVFDVLSNADANFEENSNGQYSFVMERRKNA